MRVLKASSTKMGVPNPSSILTADRGELWSVGILLKSHFFYGHRKESHMSRSRLIAIIYNERMYCMHKILQCGGEDGKTDVLTSLGISHSFHPFLHPSASP